MISLITFLDNKKKRMKMFSIKRSKFLFPCLTGIGKEKLNQINFLLTSNFYRRKKICQEFHSLLLLYIRILLHL